MSYHALRGTCLIQNVEEMTGLDMNMDEANSRNLKPFR